MTDGLTSRSSTGTMINETIRLCQACTPERGGSNDSVFLRLSRRTILSRADHECARVWISPSMSLIEMRVFQAIVQDISMTSN